MEVRVEFSLATGKLNTEHYYLKSFPDVDLSFENGHTTTVHLKAVIISDYI